MVIVIPDGCAGGAAKPHVTRMRILFGSPLYRKRAVISFYAYAGHWSWEFYTLLHSLLHDCESLAFSTINLIEIPMASHR